MIRLFSKKEKEPLKDDRSSLIRYEKDQNGIISIYFNEIVANNSNGVYQSDYDGKIKKIGIPKDINEKLEKYTIFEWAIENHDFIESGDTLFLIRRNENDWAHEVCGDVLIIPEIVIRETGFVDIIKKEKAEILNNDLICKITSVSLLLKEYQLII